MKTIELTAKESELLLTMIHETKTKIFEKHKMDEQIKLSDSILSKLEKVNVE